MPTKFTEKKLRLFGVDSKSGSRLRTQSGSQGLGISECVDSAVVAGPAANTITRTIHTRKATMHECHRGKRVLILQVSAHQRKADIAPAQKWRSDCSWKSIQPFSLVRLFGYDFVCPPCSGTCSMPAAPAKSPFIDWKEAAGLSGLISGSLDSIANTWRLETMRPYDSAGATRLQSQAHHQHGLAK